MVMARVTPPSWTGRPLGSESFCGEDINASGARVAEKNPCRKPKEG